MKSRSWSLLWWLLIQLMQTAIDTQQIVLAIAIPRTLKDAGISCALLSADSAVCVHLLLILVLALPFLSVSLVLLAIT